MKMVIIIMRKLYQGLKRFIGFSIFCILLVFVNNSYLKYSIDSELVTLIMTVVSIVFGFLITAICNLYGRNITAEMAFKNGIYDKGKSQLQELKEDFINIFGICILIMLISILFLIINDINVIKINNDLLNYGFSAFYISLIILAIFALANHTFILLNMLINESYLNKHSK